MKQFRPVAAILLLSILAACSGGGGKKVLIMASGKVSVSEDQKTVTLDPGTTHNEKEISLPGSEKETLTVKSPDGSKTFDLNEGGHYLLNLKTDTLIGGIVRYGSAGMASNLSNDQVDHIIDSTEKLIAGQNASDASQTYFIVPMTIKKITASEDAKIIGPYNGIPASIDVDKNGKGPEMYKFFTNKQKRESLDDLNKQRAKSKLQQ